MQLPPWMSEKDFTFPSPGKRTRRNYLEKTILEINGFFRRQFLAEQTAVKNGLCQKIDPRVKVITFLLLIFTTGILRSIRGLLLAYFLTLVIASLSKINPASFMKKIWLATPLFTAMLVLPAIFSGITPGDPLLVLWPGILVITKQGALGAAIIILRVTVSVSLTAILVATTKWHHLFNGLRRLKVPDIFVMIAQMCLRYVGLLLTVAEEMLFARKSREVGRSSKRQGWEFIGNSIGNLWGRSRWLGDEVYLAMLSRGYSGVPRCIENSKFSRFDAVWSLFVFASVLALLLVDKID